MGQVRIKQSFENSELGMLVQRTEGTLRHFFHYPAISEMDSQGQRGGTAGLVHIVLAGRNCQKMLKGKMSPSTQPMGEQEVGRLWAAGEAPAPSTGKDWGRDQHPGI